ncbi:MAG: hypothetical protein M1816_004575 [Peltula sp. TS41687]|nr:MAG: hypothetical protein M1816_004575 [Peltula sp. TS41687]
MTKPAQVVSRPIAATTTATTKKPAPIAVVTPANTTAKKPASASQPTAASSSAKPPMQPTQKASTPNVVKKPPTTSTDKGKGKAQPISSTTSTPAVTTAKKAVHFASATPTASTGKKSTPSTETAKKATVAPSSTSQKTSASTPSVANKPATTSIDKAKAKAQPAASTKPAPVVASAPKTSTDKGTAKTQPTPSAPNASAAANAPKGMKSAPPPSTAVAGSSSKPSTQAVKASAAIKPALPAKESTTAAAGDKRQTSVGSTDKAKQSGTETARKTSVAASSTPQKSSPVTSSVAQKPATTSTDKGKAKAQSTTSAPSAPAPAAKTVPKATKPAQSSSPAVADSSSKPVIKPTPASATSKPVVPAKVSTNVAAGHKRQASLGSVDEAKKAVTGTVTKTSVAAKSVTTQATAPKPIQTKGSRPSSPSITSSTIKKTATASNDKGKSKVSPAANFEAKLKEQQREHERAMVDLQAKFDNQLETQIEAQRELIVSSDNRVLVLTLEAGNLEAALAKAESSMEEAAKNHQCILQDKEDEIMGLRQIIERLQQELQEQSASKERELVTRVDALKMQHDTYIRNMEKDHELAIEQLVVKITVSMGHTTEEVTQLRAERDKEIQELEEKHQSSAKGLRKEYDDLMVAKRELAKSVQKMKTDHETDLFVEKENFKRLEMGLRRNHKTAAKKAREEQEEATVTIRTLEERVQEMEQWLADEKQERVQAEAALAKAKSEYTKAVNKLKRGLKQAAASVKSKDKEINSLTEELERMKILMESTHGEQRSESDDSSSMETLIEKDRVAGQFDNSGDKGLLMRSDDAAEQRQGLDLDRYSIQGTLAGIKTQLEQIQDVNEDWAEEEARSDTYSLLLKKLGKYLLR